MQPAFTCRIALAESLSQLTQKRARLVGVLTRHPLTAGTRLLTTWTCLQPSGVVVFTSRRTEQRHLSPSSAWLLEGLFLCRLAHRVSCGLMKRNMTVTIEPELHETLVELATQKNRSVSYLVSELLHLALANLKVGTNA